jgi:tRNA/tmRNA/rRNA uracil-C5-methylase (TrmA/RlmC/RlmD family)
MTKKKMICQYELLWLGKEKDKLISRMEKFLGKESIKNITEKDWKPVYKINQLSEASYLLVNFVSPRQKIPSLCQNVLRAGEGNSSFRYNLVNLTNKKRNKVIRR